MSEAITQAAAYDLIDRFLRNNLYDDDYAKYSEALEAISQPAPSPQPAVPVVSEDDLVACLISSGCVGTVKMSFESGPMSITRPSLNATKFARAILALRPQAAIPEIDVHKDGDGDAHVCLSLGDGSFFDCSVSPSGSVAWAFRLGEHKAHKKEQVDWSPQAVPMTPEQLAVLRFCWGSGTLDGLGFGDKHPELPGSFWWRNHLAEAFPGITARAEGVKP